MATTGFTFINTSAGMAVNFTAHNDDLYKNIRVQVTDVHDSTHGATAVAPSSEQNPTGASHGSFSKGAYIGAAFTSIPVVSGTSFTLRAGVTYKAKVFLAGHPIPATAGGTDFHLDETYVPPPVASDYAVTLNHYNKGFKLAISLADATNPAGITSYSVVVTDTDNMTWFNTFTGSELVETLIKCDGDAPPETSDTTDSEGLTNGDSYEVQVVGINVTSGVIDAPSFHVVPRTVPNVPASFGVDVGKDVTGSNYAVDANGVYVNATSDGDCIEVSLTAADAIDADSPDLAYVVQVGTKCKYYTSAPTDLVITTGDAGWYADIASVTVPLAAHVTALAADSSATLAASAGSETLTLANGTEVAVSAYVYNKWGMGTRSAVLDRTPSTRPAAPTGSALVGALVPTGGPGSGKIAVSITAENNGGAVLGGQIANDFKYTFTLDDGINTTTQESELAMADATGGVYELIGLDDGTEYTVSVVAENINAQSASLALGSFTPRDAPGAPDLTGFTAAPHKDAKSDLGSGNASGTGASNFIAANGANNITYQYQMNVNSDFSGAHAADVSGVDLMSPAFDTLNDAGVALTDGTEYYLRVSGINEERERGPYVTYKVSGADQLIVPSVPPAVDARAMDPSIAVIQSHGSLKVQLGTGDGLVIDNGGYPINDYEIEARNDSGNFVETKTVSATNGVASGTFDFSALPTNGQGTTQAGDDVQGTEAYHNFSIRVRASSTVYGYDDANGAAYTGPDATSGTFSVTNDVRPITINAAATDTTGTGDNIRGDLAYSLSIPHGFQYAPLNNTLLYRLEGDEWTQATAGAVIAKSGFDTIVADASAVTPTSVRQILPGSTPDTTLDLGTVATGLLLGSEYKLVITATSKDTYASASAPIPMPAVESPTSTLIAKPFLDVTSGVITISSNGSELDDSFILSTQGNEWAIQNIKTSLVLSEPNAYGNNNPPFTQYRDVNDSVVGSLKSTVTPSNFNGGGNYLALTENDSGATIKLNGSIANNTLGA